MSSAFNDYITADAGPFISFPSNKNLPSYIVTDNNLNRSNLIRDLFSFPESVTGVSRLRDRISNSALAVTSRLTCQ